MKTKTLLELRDIDQFYQHFVKKDKLHQSDLDAKPLMPPLTKFFRIHRTEYALRVIGPELPPNRYNFYFISLITRGYARKTDYNQSFEICPHTLWGTPLGQIHSAQQWSEDSSGYYISFSPDFLIEEPVLRRLVNEIPLFRYDAPHRLHLSENTSFLLLDIFRKIEAEFKDGTTQDRISICLIRVYLAELLLQVKRLFEKGSDKTVVEKNLNLVDKFKSLIEENFINEKSVAYYASKLAVHPNYLNSLCKDQGGVTAGDMIQDRIIKEAKSLLFQSTLSVKEIAYYLNFKESSHFSKYFRRYTGSTPQHFRKNKE